MSPAGATTRGFVAIFFWGTSIVAGRLIMGSLGLLRGPLAATLVSGVLGSVLVLARRESRRALRGLGARYWLACGGLFVSYLVAYNLGTGLASDGRQLLAFNVLNYLWPMTTLVFSAAFSRSRVRWWIVPGIAVGLAGTVLALWSQQAGPAGAATAGDIVAAFAGGRSLVVYGLGLYCGIAWGLYSALGRRLVGQSAANPVPLLFLATAAVYALLAALGVGAGPVAAAGTWASPSTAGIAAFLEGVPLNGRSVRLEGFENVLYALSRSGTYYDFGKRQFVDFETDKKSLPGWGTLRNGKEYPIAVASVDICRNSELVKKYKPAVMEKVYYRLWDFLKRRLDMHDGRMWSWAGDGGLFAFRGDRREIAAVSCCLEILYSLPVFNLQPHKAIRDDICLRIGMDSGPVKFSEDTGRIVSEVINYAAHLEKNGTNPGALSVSDEVFDRLPESLQSVFTETREFEGRTVHSTA